MKKSQKGVETILENRDIATTFLNYAKPLHTLDFLSFPHQTMNLFVYMGAVGAWLSVSICTNRRTVKIYIYIFFLLCCRLIQSCFVFPGRRKKKKKLCMFSIIWMKDICIVEYCTEYCGVIWLYLFLKFGTHFEFWFVLNTVFLALLFDHVNVKTSK